MKNRLSALLAAAALCAATAVPATAGYTVYVDAALPSVLFVEFDAPPAGEEPAVISTPGGPADVVVIGPGAGARSQGAPAASQERSADNGAAAEEGTASEDIDLAPTPQNLIENEARNQIFQDIELR